MEAKISSKSSNSCGINFLSTDFYTQKQLTVSSNVHIIYKYIFACVFCAKCVLFYLTVFYVLYGCDQN